MLLIAFYAAVFVASAAGLLACIASLRFERRVEREREDLLATRRSGGRLAPVASLPAPVRRYLEVCGASGDAVITSARLDHAGTAQMSRDARAVPIRGEQLLVSSPPGFVWWGRIRLAPGLWVDARDKFVDGHANMLVVAESTFTLQDARGAELDQGAAAWLEETGPYVPFRFAVDRIALDVVAP